jgi:hypothetical protein
VSGTGGEAGERRLGRLGLRLELDLRDNLQRVLYATGTYEPAVLRFLDQEPRAGAAANRLAVTVVEAALGAGTGTAELPADSAYDLADAGVRSLRRDGTRGQTVTVATFDDWAAEARVERLGPAQAGRRRG